MDKVAKEKSEKKTSAKKVEKKKMPAKKVEKKKMPAKKVEKKKMPAKEPLVEQNGVKRPRPGGKTAVVWEIADRLEKTANGCPNRKDVYKEAEKMGCNKNMTGSQFQSWRKFNGYSKAK